MYGHHMVRTDHRSQTLHSFIGSPAIGDQSSPHHKRFCSEQDFVCSESRRLKRNPVNLTSVLECREAFVTHEDPDARTILSRHTFVGCVTRTLALIQNQTKLYLANVRKLSQELFFQLVFEDFGNFGLMKLSPTVSLTELLSLALNSKESGYSEEEHGPQDQLIAVRKVYDSTRRPLTNACRRWRRSLYPGRIC
jgi:DNA mismatch repair protein MLH1